MAHCVSEQMKCSHMLQTENRVVPQRTPDVHQWFERFDHIPEQACRDQPTQQYDSKTIESEMHLGTWSAPTGICEIQYLTCNSHRHGSLWQFQKGVEDDGEFVGITSPSCEVI